MNDASTFDISSVGVAFVLLLGAVLIVLIFTARMAVRFLPLAVTRREAIGRVQPVVEAVLVFAWAMLTARAIFGNHPVAAPLAMIAVLLGAVQVSWFALRDIGAGVVLKAQGFCRVGDHVRSGDVSGIVRDIGVRALKLETGSGEEALIPYHRLQAEPFIKAPRLSGALRHRFQVDVPEGMPASRAREIVRIAALNSHWSAVAREPEVSVQSEESLEVMVFPIDPSRGHHIEADVRTALFSPRGRNTDRMLA